MPEKAFTFPFDNKAGDKGKPLSQVSTEALMYLISRCDANDPKYGARNKKMMDECHLIINSRTDNKTVTVPTPTNGAGSSKKADEILERVIRLEKSVYEILGILRHQFPKSLSIHENNEPDFEQEDSF